MNSRVILCVVLLLPALGPPAARADNRSAKPSADPTLPSPGPAEGSDRLDRPKAIDRNIVAARARELRDGRADTPARAGYKQNAH